MPSADDILKIILYPWFSFALLAGLAFFFDKFLVPFVHKFYIILYSTSYETFTILMITSLILPLFGLLNIYYNFCTLLSLISNKIMLIRYTAGVIYYQITFVDLILPYNTQSSTKCIFFRYNYTLWQYCFSG